MNLSVITPVSREIEISHLAGERKDLLGDSELRRVEQWRMRVNVLLITPAVVELRVLI